MTDTTKENEAELHYEVREENWPEFLKRLESGPVIHGLREEIKIQTVEPGQVSMDPNSNV